jgi:hypothetical protein
LDKKSKGLNYLGCIRGSSLIFVSEFHPGTVRRTKAKGFLNAKTFICVLDKKVGKDAAERAREVLNGMLDGK